MRRKLFTSLAVFAAALSGEDSGFKATMQDCTELIGFGPVPMAAVRPLVPAGYIIPEISPAMAGLVVRASRCQQLSTGGPARPVNIAQIGVAIVPPDGTGDINNYTLLYATSDERLARALQEAGLPAGLDPLLAFEVTPGAGGEVYTAAAPPGAYAWFLTGSANEPPPGGSPVTANWWFQTRRNVLKMATSIPAISYASATLALRTSRLSPLGQIIGGNTDTNFAFFQARGAFLSGVMTVSLK